MKKYKSISIKTRDILNLGDRISEYEQKGWRFKEIITKHIADPGYAHEFFCLFEIDIKEAKKLVKLVDSKGTVPGAQKIPPPPPPPLGRTIREGHQPEPPPKQP